MTQAAAIVPHEPEVYIRDGQIFTDSQKVATFFGKDHNKVLRDIRTLDITPEFRASSYGQTLVSGTFGAVDRTITVVEMNFDGFMFLAMGYRGKKAGAIKERYIAAFNRMREELERMKATPSLDLADPASLRTLLLGYTEKVIALEATVTEQGKVIAEATPKAEFYDAYADAGGMTALTDIGRVLNVGPIKMLQWLVDQRVLFRTAKGAPLRARNEYLKRGWFETRTVLKNDAERVQTMVTPKGIQGVAEMLGRSTDLFGRISKSDPLPLTSAGVAPATPNISSPPS